MHCLSIRYGRSRSTVYSHTTHIEHARGVRPVETCKYYPLSLSLSLSLSLIFSPLSLSQLQLAYFNSAGKREGERQGDWGSNQVMPCSIFAGGCSEAHGTTMPRLRVAWSRRQRSGEEGRRTQIAVNFPRENDVAYYRATTRSDLTRGKNYSRPTI